jgi:site-specific DNA-methyltransferase (adenine-specific)
VTSPPYFQARRYSAGTGELGTEHHVDAWVENLGAVSQEIARVLVPTGSYWLNVGDLYSRSMRLGAAEVAALGSGVSRPRALRPFEHPEALETRTR